MTALHPAPVAAATATTATTVRLHPLVRAAGVGLALAPVLLVLGVVTSPPQDSPSAVDYAASLAVDRFQTAISADLFHYAFVCWTFGVLAVVALVPGRRGRRLVTVLGAVGALTSIQMAGLLLSDHYLASIVHQTDAATGGAVLEDLGRSAKTWFATGRPAVLFLVLVPFALAWARVLPWWLALLPLLTLGLTALSLPSWLFAGLAIACFAPLYVAAYLLVRGRVTRTG